MISLGKWYGLYAFDKSPSESLQCLKLRAPKS